MSKPISLFGKQYESYVEQLMENGGEFVLRTRDQRFFRLNKQSGRLLQRIEAGVLGDVERKQAKELVEQVLLKKGIYGEVGQEKYYEAKVPKLAWHLPLFSPAVVNRLVCGLRFLLRPVVALPFICMCLYLQGRYFVEHTHHFSYSYLFSFTPGELLVLLIASLAGSLFHELGHATACRHYTGKAGEIGVGINIVVPVFFANVSNLYMARCRQRLVIGLSGLYFQAIFSTLLLMAMYGLLPMEKYLVINLFSMLLNGAPLFRNDGYWVLNDALGRRDLMSETAAKLVGRQRLSWIESLYACMFVIMVGLMAWLIGRFILVRGPELIAELVQARSWSFTLLFRFILVSVQYLAIVLGAYMLLKQCLLRPLKLKFTRINKV